MFDSRCDQGFYVIPGTLSGKDKTLVQMDPKGANPEYVVQTLKPLYATPAKIRGSAQITPRAKFLSESIAILNFQLDAFRLDTGDLGKILEPFAHAFFPGDGDSSPIYQEIVYNLSENRHEHKKRIQSAIGRLRGAR
jgi:hypothetical protein